MRVGPLWILLVTEATNARAIVAANIVWSRERSQKVDRRTLDARCESKTSLVCKFSTEEFFSYQQ